MSKFCINCGTSLVDEAKFCSACGHKQPTFTEQTETTPTIEQFVTQRVEPIYQDTPNFIEYGSDKQLNKVEKKKTKIINLIKLITLSTLSLVMFIMAFLPIYKVEQKISGEKVSVSINAIDNVIFMFDSFHSETYDELEDSDLYYQLEELEEEVEDIYEEDGEITPEVQRIISKYAKIFARLNLRSEDVSTTPSIITNGIISLTYLVISAITFIFAVIKLLANLEVLRTNKNLLIVYKLLVLTLGFAIILTALNVNTERLAKIGGGALTTFIVFGIAFTSIIILNILNGAKFKISNLITRSISTIVAILVIALAFSPVFSAEITANFDNGNKRTATTKFENEIYEEFFSISDEDMETIDYIKSLNKTSKKERFEEMALFLSGYTPQEIKKGEANYQIAYLIGTVFLSKSVDGISTIFAFTTLFFILALISATSLLIDNLKYFMTGKSDKISNMNNKILTLVFTAIAFILNIIFVITTNNMLSTYIPSIELILTAGPMIMLLFAIVLVCLPYKKEESSFIE